MPDAALVPCSARPAGDAPSVACALCEAWGRCSPEKAHRACCANKGVERQTCNLNGLEPGGHTQSKRNQKKKAHRGMASAPQGTAQAGARPLLFMRAPQESFCTRTACLGW